MPIKQAIAITEYIQTTAHNTQTQQSSEFDRVSISAIGSNHQVSQKGQATGPTVLVRSLFDRNHDPHHPESSGVTVQEFELKNDPRVKQRKTHQQWARLNLLCLELGIPIRFGIGWSAQNNPKLYFRIIVQASTVGWSRAYKIKPDLQIPQPLGKKDVWIVKAIQRGDSAATVFWGSWVECNAEQDRRKTNDETAKVMPEKPIILGQHLDDVWEGLNTDSGHPYKWKWTDSGSHTRTYSFKVFGQTVPSDQSSPLAMPD